MDPNTFPTKGNLILARNTLRMSNLGYDLLEKKRNVLVKEIMELNVKAKKIQDDINRVFTEAYAALQRANIELGISDVERISFGIPLENTVNIKTRSIMGVEIPMVDYKNSTDQKAVYGLSFTSSSLDEALVKFNRVKDLIAVLSMIENAAYRLAISIRKTQKRSNALKNITIPQYEALAKNIQETLEERERDEFTRLKVVKKWK